MADRCALLYSAGQGMRTRFDQFYKAALSALLQPFTHLEVSREIPGHVQVADLWVQPESAHAGGLARLGMLGRMIMQGPCLIEPFSRPPSMREVHTCVLEQHALDHARFLEAERESLPEPVFPRLWIISAGRPESVLGKMTLFPMKDWPSGFWQRDDLHLIVVRDLPRTPDTLFLRLLSRGAFFTEAVRELVALHGDTREGQVIISVLIAFRREIPQDSIIIEEDMELLGNVENLYQQVMDEGRLEGRREGLIKAIEMFCAASDIELSDQRRQTLASLELARLEAHLAELVASRRWPGQ
jgi:hypothetical protein